MNREQPDVSVSEERALFVKQFHSKVHEILLRITFSMESASGLSVTDLHDLCNWRQNSPESHARLNDEQFFMFHDGIKPVH